MASMTASEMRDRLDHRFRLLVGSRRGLERHHTLRHAMAWSYDLLDDTEKTVLDRCSVFAGGFDLQSACTVAGSDDLDEYAILEVLDALVRKSLLIADRSSGRTRFQCWRRSASSPRTNSSPVGRPPRSGLPMPAISPDAKPTSWPCGTAPASERRTAGFTTEFANLRTAFRWAADHGDLDVAAAVATYAGILGICVDNYEPITWTEEVIERARADHPRLAFLYVIASQCWRPGRIEAAVRYCDAGQLIISSGSHEVPFGLEGGLGVAYQAIGQPQRCVEWCRAQLAYGRDTHTFTRACLVNALMLAGCSQEARTATNGLVDAAEATHNPYVLSFALWAHAYAFRDADPVPALEALRRGLVIARDSGNRFNESHLAVFMSVLEAEHGDPLTALDYVALAIRNFQDAGDTALMRTSLAVLAAFSDRLGRHEPAATIAGFAIDPFTSAALPEINTLIAHLRDVLGDQTYESLARKGETMTTAAMATYAYNQIDQARTELNAVS
jgi:hypothetical protein